MIRLAAMTLLFLLLVAFFVQNQEERVTIHYLFGLQSATVPIYQPVLGAFLIGLLVAALLFVPTWVRGRVQLRRTTRALRRAEADLEDLRLATRPATPSGPALHAEQDYR